MHAAETLMLRARAPACLSCPCAPVALSVHCAKTPREKQYQTTFLALERNVSNPQKIVTEIIIDLKVILESFPTLLSLVKHFHLPEYPTWQTPIHP